MRIGHGFDVHAFDEASENNDGLILGGVRIAYPRLLKAHSDGDVVIHALVDALLGAAGLGDIGRLFPDSDPAYHGMDSRVFLREARQRLQDQSMRPHNVDITIVAEAPRMAGHIEAMQQILASDLAIDSNTVNVKATTTEKLGYIGRGEGIAVHAVVLLDKMSEASLADTPGSDAIASQLAEPYRFQHAYAYGGPVIQAHFKQQPQDFQVREELSFSLTGEGEHACVLIQKTAANTEWVARQLAQFAGVSDRQVSYAGLKDRHAVTAQWFSIHLPKRQAPDWKDFAAEGCLVLETSWNSKKLRRGALRCNHFRIVLRDSEGDLDQLPERLAAIRTAGFPNYFAEQRFGHNGNNLAEAQQLFASGKRLRPSHKRGLWLSAARSWLFNRVLDKRVQLNNWQQVMSGDVAVLEGTHSLFVATDEPDLRSRSEQLDIHPSGPLWGVGENRVQGVPAQLEQHVLEPFQEWCQGLENYKTRMDRRALRCIAQDLELENVDATTLVLHFSLPPGSYATALLREIALLST